MPLRTWTIASLIACASALQLPSSTHRVPLASASRHAPLWPARLQNQSPLAAAAATLGWVSPMSAFDYDSWVDLNRPPIEFQPEFKINPIGWVFIALYVGYLNFQIFKPPSAAELEYEKEMEVESAKAKEAAPAFLQAAREAEGATVQPSGLVYRELVAGTGAAPTADDTVLVQYTGSLADGSVFDSSVERGQPAEFKVGQVIKGWQEGLQLMRVGGKAVLTVPAELAYGPQPVGDKIPGWRCAACRWCSTRG